MVETDHRIGLPVERRDAVPVPCDLLAKRPACPLDETAFELSTQPVGIDHTTGIGYERCLQQPYFCHLGDLEIHTHADASHRVLVLRIGDPPAKGLLRLRPRRQAGLQALQNSDSARVLQMRLAEVPRISPHLSGCLVHKAFQRKNVRGITEAAQSGCSVRQAIDEVLHQPFVVEGVNRVEVAVHAAMTVHVRHGGQQRDGIGTKLIGQKFRRSRPVWTCSRAATVGPTDGLC